jgi:hypothetical protein
MAGGAKGQAKRIEPALCEPAPAHFAAGGILGCCARAASGHAAAPPSSVMNSRRFN